MRRTALVLALLASMGACTPRSTAPPPPPAASAAASAAAPEPVAAPAPADAGAPQATKSPGPSRLEVVKLDTVNAEIPVRSLEGGTPFSLTPEYEGWIEDPPRWVTHGGHAFGAVRLHERPSGRELGTIEGSDMRDLALAHGVFVGYRQQRPAIMRLTDGRVLVPMPELAKGAPATPELVLVPRSPLDNKTDRKTEANEKGDVVVVARAKDRALWYGFWDSFESAEVRLLHKIPLDGKFASYNQDSRVWELAAEPGRSGGDGSSTCPRARLARTGPVCLTATAGGPSFTRQWLGDWVASDHALEHGTDGRVHEVPPAKSLLAALDHPSRALFAWQDGDERHVDLVGPSGSIGRWRYPSPAANGNTYHSAAGIPERPVISEQEIAWKKPASTFFVDLERAVIFKTEALDAQGVWTVGRRSLVVRPGTTTDTLVFLDLDARRAEALGTMPHCPSRYWAGVQRGDLFTIHCSKQPNPAQFRFFNEWSEIVDVRARRRFHTVTPWYAVDVLPDGRVLLASKSERPVGPLRAVTLPN